MFIIANIEIRPHIFTRDKYFATSVFQVLGTKGQKKEQVRVVGIEPEAERCAPAEDVGVGPARADQPRTGVGSRGEAAHRFGLYLGPFEVEFEGTGFPLGGAK